MPCAPPRRRSLVRAAPVALAILGSASEVHASPLIELQGSLADNAGMQGVVTGPGSASTYWNPALLVDADESILFAYSLVSEQVGVTLYGRTGGDVPVSVGGRNITSPNGAPISNTVVPTAWLQNGCPAGVQAGQCPAPGFAARPRQSQGYLRRQPLLRGLRAREAPRPQSLLHRLLCGGAALEPHDGPGLLPRRAGGPLLGQPPPQLYGDRLTSISLALGAAFKIVPQISVGASLGLGLANTANANSYVSNASNYSTLLVDNGVTTQVNFSPIVGLKYVPVSWLRFGASLHSPEKFTVATTIDATLPSGTTSSATIDNVFDWMPWSFSVGGEVDVLSWGRYTMALTGSLKYAFWSNYIDRAGQSPGVYGNALAWSDTLSGTVGIRHRYGDLRGFIDLGYVPSPVPEQIRPVQLRRQRPRAHRRGRRTSDQIGRARLRPGLQLFVNRLIRRENVKDDAMITDEVPDGSVFSTTGKPVPGSVGLQTNNPGWPGFASEGWVWGGGDHHRGSAMSFERLGQWVFTHRWLTLAGSTVFLALAVVTLTRGGVLTGPIIQGIEAERAQAVVEQVLGHTMDTTVVALFRANAMDPRNQDFQSAIKDALEPVRADPRPLGDDDRRRAPEPRARHGQPEGPFGLRAHHGEGHVQGGAPGVSRRPRQAHLAGLHHRVYRAARVRDQPRRHPRARPNPRRADLAPARAPRPPPRFARPSPRSSPSASARLPSSVASRSSSSCRA